jgi:hypothetical protein
VKIADHRRPHFSRLHNGAQRLLGEVSIHEQGGGRIDRGQIEIGSTTLEFASIRNDETPLAAVSLHEHNGDRRDGLGGGCEPSGLHAEPFQRPPHEATVIVIAEHGEYVRVTAEHRGLGNSGPGHAAGQDQALGESGARLCKIEPLDDIDVIDHAQSETDDFFVRHGNSPACGNGKPKPVATANLRRSQRQGPSRWQRQTQGGGNDRPKAVATTNPRRWQRQGPSRWQPESQAGGNGKTRAGGSSNSKPVRRRPQAARNGEPQPRVAYRNRPDSATIRPPPRK